MGAYDCDCINNLEYDRRERKQKEQSQSTTGQLNDGARSTAQSTDLIDRRAAIDAVNNAFDRETLLTGFVRSIAVRAIRDMPSAQPEPKVEFHDKDHVWIDGKQYISLRRFQEAVKEAQPKEGYWKKDEKDDCPPVFRRFRICSVCGAIETSETSYCPNCGAKMTISTK